MIECKSGETPQRGGLLRWHEGDAREQHQRVEPCAAGDNGLRDHDVKRAVLAQKIRRENFDGGRGCPGADRADGLREMFGDSAEVGLGMAD